MPLLTREVACLAELPSRLRTSVRELLALAEHPDRAPALRLEGVALMRAASSRIGIQDEIIEIGFGVRLRDLELRARRRDRAPRPLPRPGSRHIAARERPAPSGRRDAQRDHEHCALRARVPDRALPHRVDPGPREPIGGEELGGASFLFCYEPHVHPRGMARGGARSPKTRSGAIRRSAVVRTADHEYAVHRIGIQPISQSTRSATQLHRANRVRERIIALAINANLTDENASPWRGRRLMGPRWSRRC